MRVFCRECRGAIPSESEGFDENIVCSKCNVVCFIPTVFQCAQHGLLEELQFLLKEMGDFDVNMRDESDATLLHWAALNNRLRLMMYLLDLPGIDVNLVGGDLKSTPIYWAAHRNNVYAVALLLEHKADPNICDINGYNAYFVAVQSGFTILAAYLVAMGCPVDTRSQDEKKITPLLWLCRYSFDLDTMRMLYGLGANIRATDAYGNTGLHLAARSDVVKAVKFLLDHGADIYARNDAGETPFDVTTQVTHEINERSGGTKVAACYGFLKNVVEYEARYNTFPLNILKKHAVQSSFWLPWIVLGLGAWCLHALNGFFMIMTGWFATAVLAYYLFKVSGLNVNPGKRKNAPLMLGVNVGSTFWLSLVFLCVLMDRVSVTTSMILLALAFGIPICLYVTAVRDPGFIPTSYEERVQNIRALVDMKSPSDIKLCTTCLQRRPLRSKHDAELNMCVARFDHYCPFVANAVGANNHNYFFGFLFFAVAAIGMEIFLFIWYFGEEGVWAKSFWDIPFVLFHDYPVVTAAMILATVHILWIGYLFLFNLYGILYSWTTNEFVLSGRNPTPEITTSHSVYSRGMLQNTLDFFHIKFTPAYVNWRIHHFYSVKDLHERASDNHTKEA
ncbi:palmitoyltransferase ZDHHC17-like [Thraustotheca clavata]|uniref:Palmitoyltransferase n=1 Tax=Thraustotheca clavata TaxID=74557 RepID=A0A1V9Y7Q4_9STRA|nr:palmitoyltransferase ZDHHC17-like [Thraustotheca clavata]